MRSIPVPVIAAVLLVSVPATAGHGGAAFTAHVTYELGPTVSMHSVDDPVGITQDGHIDTAGYIFRPDMVPKGVDEAQASVTDDVWGTGVVAGTIASDENGNEVYGETEQGEVYSPFCGESPVVDIPAAPGWNGVAVYVGLPYMQYLFCDPIEAPTGATTGGVLNPNGGLFVTFG